MATLPGTKSENILQELDDIENLGTDAPLSPPVPDTSVIEAEPIQSLNKPIQQDDPVVELDKPIVPPQPEPEADPKPDIVLQKRAPNIIQLELLKQQARERMDRKEQFKSLKRRAYFRQRADIRGGIAEAVSDILLDPLSDIATIVLTLLVDPLSFFQEGSHGQNLGRDIQKGLNDVYGLFGIEGFTPEETGLDKGIPYDAFSTIFKQPIFPVTSEESLFDLGPLIPPAEQEFGNVGTQERSRKFIESKEAATGVILSPIVRLFRLMKAIKPGDTRIIPKIKEFLRKQGEAQTDFPDRPIPTLSRPGGFPVVSGEGFITGIPLIQPVDKASLRSAAVDVVGSIFFARGVTAAKENAPNSLFYEMVFGTAHAAFFTGLTLRTLSQYSLHLRDLISMKVGILGSEKRAKTLLQKLAGDDKEKILEKLFSEGVDADGNPIFLPGFYAALPPDLATQNQKVINLFTAFLEENADLKTARSTLHQELSDMILEMVRTRAVSTDVTEETITKALLALDDLIQKRIRLTMQNTADTVAKVSTHLTQDEAHRLGVRAIIKEQEIAEETEHVFWNKMHLRGIRVSPKPGVLRWEEVLREVGPEEGTGILNLGKGEGKKDLYKFLGKLEEEKGAFDVVLGTRAPDRFVFKAGKWGDNISMQEAQNMRSRTLRAIREERVADVPNERRIAMLEKAAAGLLAIQTSLTKEQLAATPNLVKMYEAAKEATAIVKKRFYTGEVYNMLRIRKGGEAQAEEIGLEAIFRGAGATKGKAGDLAIKQILEDVHGGPIKKGEQLTGHALEVAQAMEELFKIRFNYHAMTGDVVNSRKAAAFVKARSEALKNFPQLKADFDEVVRTNDASILKIKRYEQALKDIHNEKISMATLYTKKGPNSTFDEYTRNPDRPEKEMIKDITELIRLANQEPTGKAREGLSGSFLLWMVSNATHKQKNNLEMPEIIAGNTLKRLWNSKPVKVAAKMMFTKDQHLFMKQLLESTETLDRGVLSHAGLAGTADLKPDKMLENLLRIIILDKFPLFRGGGGSIAKQSILSKAARDVLYKVYKNPAHAAIVEAFLANDKTLLRELFKDIITPEDAIRAGIVFNTWFQTGLLNAGMREKREEQKREEQQE